MYRTAGVVTRESFIRLIGMVEVNIKILYVGGVTGEFVGWLGLA
jgi:hypothetical protein